MPKDPKFQLKYEVEAVNGDGQVQRQLFADRDDALIVFYGFFYDLANALDQILSFELRLKEHGEDGPKVLEESTPAIRSKVRKRAKKKERGGALPGSALFAAALRN
jgi:hypothetical protein